MNTRNLLLIAVALVLPLFLPAVASADTIITVEVVDDQGNPVIGADVEIVDSAGKVIRGKTGGKKGGFRTFWKGNNAGEVFTITATKGKKTGTVKQRCAQPPKTKTKAKVTIKQRKKDRLAGERPLVDLRERRPLLVRGNGEILDRSAAELRVPGETSSRREQVGTADPRLRLQDSLDWAVKALEAPSASLGEVRTVDRESAARAGLIAALTASARSEDKEQACKESSEDCSDR